jgi:glycosyltransferase involved in cell wall biosynthesis
MIERSDILYLFRGAGHGGDAIAMLRLAAAMRNRGLGIRCAASPFEDHFEAFRSRANSMGLDCDSVPYYDATGGSRARFAAALARYLRKLRPRVVHLHTGNGFVNPSLAMTLAAAHRGRRIVTLHGVRSRELTEAGHLRDQDISERFFYAVITPTQYSRESYLACAAHPCPERIYAIGNLVGAGASKSRCVMRQELKIACQSQVVLFAARLVETKGPLVAIRAFARIAGKHPSAILLLAGDGPLLQACRDAAEVLGQRVRFLGHREDVNDLMAAADLYLTASRFESFGLTTLEAMAAGATVVSFDLPATRELLGGTGRLAVNRDEASLAAELDWALSNPVQSRQLSIAARARYESVYPVDAIIRGHLEMYGVAQ